MPIIFIYFNVNSNPEVIFYDVTEHDLNNLQKWYEDNEIWELINARTEGSFAAAYEDSTTMNESVLHGVVETISISDGSYINSDDIFSLIDNSEKEEISQIKQVLLNMSDSLDNNKEELGDGLYLDLMTKMSLIYNLLK